MEMVLSCAAYFKMPIAVGLGVGAYSGVNRLARTAERVFLSVSAAGICKAVFLYMQQQCEEEVYDESTCTYLNYVEIGTCALSTLLCISVMAKNMLNKEAPKKKVLECGSLRLEKTKEN